MMKYRRLATTDIEISEVALGCWPIAGITSPGTTTDKDSIATIQACFELGINQLDTAYVYGRDGESEKLIGRALDAKSGSRRDEMVIATKGGLHWGETGTMDHDASPERLRSQCDESLQRLGTDRVELLYLHAPDPKVPVAESAGALKRLMEEGKARAIGVSNVNLDQLKEFAGACPLAAFQPPYNMLQRQIEADTLPWCREQGVSVLIYWPLVKGLLAGKLARDHVFGENDSRRKYAMFLGDEWEKNHDLVDRLREIAAETGNTGAGHTVAELVINWTLRQPGITCTLCGAKRPDQIQETAGGSGWTLTDDQYAAITQALADRGDPKVDVPV